MKSRLQKLTKLSLFVKKRNKVWIWLAVDRNRNKIVDFEVGNRSKRTYFKLAQRLEKTYKIRHLCTDGYEVYGLYKISEFHHKTKSETSLVESKNSLIRTFLVRFNRRTRRYSKSIEMIFLSLKLLFAKLNGLCFQISRPKFYLLSYKKKEPLYAKFHNKKLETI